MKKAVILGERRAGLITAPDPQPKADWVVVKVNASAICTEYKAFLAGRRSDTIRHEGAGEVVAVAQPGPVNVGDRVEAEQLCIDATRRRGRVAFVGECSQDLTIRVSPDMIRKGLTVVGSWLCILADSPHVIKVIRESPLIDQLISHVMPMSQIQDAFELLASGECAKVVLKPWA